MTAIISSAYAVNLDSRLLDKILYVVGINDMPLKLLKFVLSPLSIDTYNQLLLPLLRQFLLFPNRINKFMFLRENFLSSALISSAGI